MESSEIPITKRELYKEIIGFEPDSLFMFSGGIAKVTSRTGKERFRHGSYTDLENNDLMSGGKARVIAIAELATCFPNIPIVTNSMVNPDEPTHAEVAKKHLVGLGVDEERIIEQTDSYSTFTELIALLKLVKKNKWQNVATILNEFHIPRAKAMLQKIDSLHDPEGAYKDPIFQEALIFFKEENPQISFVSAEEILPHRNPRYKEIVERAKKSDLWLKREVLEKNGAEQINNGTYWKKEHDIRFNK